jgi:membrane protein DedA with SNARE-associated domain
MAELLDSILFYVSSWGYTGIFIMMAIESSIIPLPSEVVMIPAGYLVHKGEMNLMGIIISGTAGSVVGALVNYYLASILGRKVIQKYGKYFFISPQRLAQVENFFESHGSFSTFFGRLLPVFRHLISIPAGFALMNKKKFVFFTGAGACIWVVMLTALGYFIGQNKMLINSYLRLITLLTLVALLIGVVVYIKILNRRKLKANDIST